MSYSSYQEEDRGNDNVRPLALEATEGYKGASTKWIPRDEVPDVTVPQAQPEPKPANPYDYGYYNQPKSSPRKEYLCVSVPNFLVGNEVRQSLLTQLDEMASTQEPKDYRHEAWTEESREINPKQREYGSTETHTVVRRRVRVHDLIDPSLSPLQFRSQHGMEQQWLPSDINVDSSGAVTFLSQINNMDANKFPKFQEDCAKVLTQMIPHFEVILKEKLRDRTLQVITKVQKYQVWPDGHYEGDLHIEGTDYEHISAVGIYYIDVDERLQGGQLELARVEATGCGWVSVRRESVNVYDNHCVVFDNRRNKKSSSVTSTQYHRMKKVSLSHHNYYGPQGERYQTKSMSEEQLQNWRPAERIIMDFFLVDPNNPIPSTKSEAVNQRFQPDLSPEQRTKLWDEAVEVRNQLRTKRGVLNQKEDPYLKTRTGMQD